MNYYRFFCEQEFNIQQYTGSLSNLMKPVISNPGPYRNAAPNATRGETAAANEWQERLPDIISVLNLNSSSGKGQKKTLVVYQSPCCFFISLRWHYPDQVVKSMFSDP